MFATTLARLSVGQRRDAAREAPPEPRNRIEAKRGSRSINMTGQQTLACVRVVASTYGEKPMRSTEIGRAGRERERERGNHVCAV